MEKDSENSKDVERRGSELIQPWKVRCTKENEGKVIRLACGESTFESW